MTQQSTQSNQKIRICKICFKNIDNEFTIHNLLDRNLSICHDCFVKLDPVLRDFECDGVKCCHIFFYNEKIQEMLYQFKGCKDYELRQTFLEYYKNYLFYKYYGYFIVPAPSFIDADNERGFNHVEEMFSVIKLKMIKCIHKTKNVKQADLSKEERQNISQSLVIDDVDLRGKKILIVDDVFTTGSTVKTMINLIRSKKPKDIKALVMSKTIDLDQR